MEPVSAAILGALTGGLASGTSDVARQAVTDGYAWLKDVLRQRLGAHSRTVEAVEKLEQNPDSARWREDLQKEISKEGADQDREIVDAANTLLEAIKQIPGGERHIQTATGNYIAQAQTGSTAAVNVNKKD